MLSLLVYQMEKNGIFIEKKNNFLSLFHRFQSIFSVRLLFGPPLVWMYMISNASHMKNFVWVCKIIFLTADLIAHTHTYKLNFQTLCVYVCMCVSVSTKYFFLLLLLCHFENLVGFFPLIIFCNSVCFVLGIVCTASKAIYSI